MTDDMMNFRTLVEKSSDSDLLREMIGFAAERLIALTRAMFAAVWEQRREQATEIIRSGERQIEAAEKRIETLLSRILDASNTAGNRGLEHLKSPCLSRL